MSFTGSPDKSFRYLLSLSSLGSRTFMSFVTEHCYFRDLNVLNEDLHDSLIKAMSTMRTLTLIHFSQCPSLAVISLLALSGAVLIFSSKAGASGHTFVNYLL